MSFKDGDPATSQRQFARNTGTDNACSNDTDMLQCGPSAKPSKRPLNLNVERPLFYLSLPTPAYQANGLPA
jgi:hypothetical protein